MRRLPTQPALAFRGSRRCALSRPQAGGMRVNPGVSKAALVYRHRRRVGFVRGKRAVVALLGAAGPPMIDFRRLFRR